MSIVCVPQNTFWELELVEIPTRPRALSDFALELVAREDRQRPTASWSFCSDETSERSTCPAEDESETATDDISLPDTDVEELAASVPIAPTGHWWESRASHKSSMGSGRLIGKPIAATSGVRCLTTVVLRRLPTTWTREDLVSFLASCGFQGCFDFVYLPINFKKNQAFGFALVNFLTTSDAQRALAAVAGLILKERPILAEWSEAIQGTHALIEKYRNSAFMLDEDKERHRPMLFSQGLIVPFPKPTQSLRPSTEKALLQRMAKAEQASSERTTLVIRKLGRKSCADELMKLLDNAGFAAEYDFVYVPRHFSRGSSFGFGIVNFVNDALASAALQKIAAGAMSMNGSMVTAAWSDTMHGLASLIEKYRNNKVMRKDMPKSFLPVVLSHGVPIPYPRHK